MSFLTKFFNSFDVVICISLVESSDRRKYMLSLVKKYCIHNFQFLDAVSADDVICHESYRKGRVASFPPCFRCGKLSCGGDECNNTLIPPQVATFLSYEKAWRFLTNNQYRNALIIEDDLAVAELAEVRAAAILEQGMLEKNPVFTNDRAFLLRFGWALCKEHDSEEPVSFVPETRMSNPCHAINKKMAAKLLATADKIYTTVDIYQHKDSCDESNSLSCIPPLFFELSWSTGAVDSLIHPKKIRLDYLKESGAAIDIYNDAKNKLNFHRKHTSVFSILGLGHPRCGSGYTASVLNALGLRVGHEKLETDGIVSWMFATDDEAPWALNDGAKTRKFKYFQNIIHHVRDPRTAIPSILRDDKYSEISHQFRRQSILKFFSIDIDTYDTPLARAVASLIFWNKMIAEQAPDIVYRVEDQEQKLVDFIIDKKLIYRNALDYVNVKLPEKNINANKAYRGKHYSKPIVSFEDYFNLPADLFNSLNEYCALYGYPSFEDKNKKVIEL